MVKIKKDSDVWTRAAPHHKGRVVRVLNTNNRTKREYEVAFEIDGEAVAKTMKPSQLLMNDPSSEYAKAVKQRKREKREEEENEPETQLVTRIRTNDPSLVKLDLDVSPANLYGTGRKNLKKFIEALRANTTIKQVHMDQGYLPPEVGGRVGLKQLNSIMPALGKNLETFVMRGSMFGFSTNAPLGAIAALLNAGTGIKSLTLYDTILVGDLDACDRFYSALSSHRCLEKVSMQFKFRRNNENGNGDIAKACQTLDFEKLMASLANTPNLRELELVPNVTSVGDNSEQLSFASIATLCRAPSIQKLVLRPQGLSITDANLEPMLVELLRDNSNLRELALPGDALSEATCTALLQILKETNVTLTKIKIYAEDSFFNSLVSLTGADLFTAHWPEIDFFLRLNQAGRRLLYLDGAKKIPNALWPKILAKIKTPDVLNYFIRNNPLLFKDAAALQAVSQADRPSKRTKLASATD